MLACLCRACRMKKNKTIVLSKCRNAFFLSRTLPRLMPLVLASLVQSDLAFAGGSNGPLSVPNLTPLLAPARRKLTNLARPPIYASGSGSAHLEPKGHRPLAVVVVVGTCRPSSFRLICHRRQETRKPPSYVSLRCYLRYFRVASFPSYLCV